MFKDDSIKFKRTATKRTFNGTMTLDRMAQIKMTLGRLVKIETLSRKTITALPSVILMSDILKSGTVLRCHSDQHISGECHSAEWQLVYYHLMSVTRLSFC